MAIARIFELAQRAPEKTAVVHNGVCLSYEAFARRIESARRYLALRDMPMRGVAVIRAESLLDAWAMGIALRDLGLTTVATQGRQPISSLGLRDVGCVVTTASEREAVSEWLAGDKRWPIAYVPVDVPPDDSIAATRGSFAPVATNEHAGGHIILTSGTTGSYKKVLRDPAAESRAIPEQARAYGISDQSRVYVANLPLWTAGGYRWPLMTWTMGGTVVIHDAPDLHQPLLDHDLTHFFTTPAALGGLIGGSQGNLRRNDTMRLLVTGGALPKALLEAAQQFLTREIYSVLASTESSFIGITRIEDSDDLLWHSIHPSCEVRVVDEAGSVLGPEQIGFVRIRAIDGIDGYLDDDEATRAFFRDGYFYPDDVGMFGEDGRLTLGGRVSDVVNVLGNKIATAPIERALQDRLDVEGVCIVSLPGDDADEELCLVIQSTRRIEAAEVEAAASAGLGLIRGVPMRVVFVDSLPRNDMGKVQRLILKQQLARARDSDDARVD